MSGQGASAERAASPTPVAPRRTSGRVVRLPVYDVRLRRELAHRGFVVSGVRQTLGLVTLRGLDAIGVVLAFLLARELAGSRVTTQALPAIIAFMLVALNVRGSYRAGAARRDGERLLMG